MMSKKKIVKLNLNQVKEFLLKKNLVIKKNRKSLFSNDFKSFNYTFLCSLVIVAIFFTLPTSTPDSLTSLPTLSSPTEEK